MSKMTVHVYWEQQGRDRMCGLHCLNSLLQGPYFDEADLANIARELDREEEKLMAVNDTNIPQESHHVSDDGFFSVSVIETCLKRCQIACIPATKPEMAASIEDPTIEEAFLCNLSNHWLAIRKVNQRWYNLDSLKPAPQSISEFYLSECLRTLVLDGYSLFVIRQHPPSNSISESDIPPPGGFECFRILLPLKPLNSHQMYLTNEQTEMMYSREELKTQQDHAQAQRLVDRDSSGSTSGTKNFLYKSPNDDSKPIVWPPTHSARQLESSSMTSTTLNLPIAPASQSPEDLLGQDEVSKVIRLSLKVFFESLPRPPPEPTTSALTCPIQIRFPDGTRQARRFLLDGPVIHIFWWLEAEASVDCSTSSSRLAVVLGQTQSYTLCANSLGKRCRITKTWGDNIDVSNSSYEGVSDVIPNAAYMSLKELGIDGATYNLQINLSI